MDKNTLLIVGVVGIGFLFLLNRQPIQQGQQGQFGAFGQPGQPFVGPGAVNQTASDFEQWFGAFSRSVQQGAAAYQSVRNAIQNPTGTPPARA